MKNKKSVLVGYKALLNPRHNISNLANCHVKSDGRTNISQTFDEQAY